MVASGLTGKRLYLDASSLIYAVESPTQFPLLSDLFAEVQLGKVHLVASTILLSEVLVLPIKSGNRTLEREYRMLLAPSDALTIIPVDEAVAIRAAQLRAEFGFRLPDAIHIATGLIAGCDLFLTGDLAWARAGIQVLTPF